MTSGCCPLQDGGCDGEDGGEGEGTGGHSTGNGEGHVATATSTGSCEEKGQRLTNGVCVYGVMCDGV